MNLRCDWLILCERAYVDANGNYCLTGIFERSRPLPGELDVNLRDRTAVAFLRGEPGQVVDVSLALHGPDGEVLVNMPTEPRALHHEFGTGQTEWTLVEFRLAVGSYEFRLHEVGAVIAVAPLEIFAPKDTAV